MTLQRLARIAVVQALYAADLNRGGALVQDGFCDDDEIPFAYDVRHFRKVLHETMAREEEIRGKLETVMERRGGPGALDAVMRALLMAAACEMTILRTAPPRVIITEYVGVARAFYGRGEPALVNGVLDRLARLDEGTAPFRESGPADG